jgi:hypothetical protein
MRQCTHCQAELPDHAQFCSHCGTPVIYDQPQSADDPNVDMERDENTFLAEQRQSPAAFEDSEAPGEEPAQAEEDQLPGAVQQSAEIASTEETGDEHADIPADVPEGEGVEEKAIPSAMSPPPTILGESVGDDEGLPPEFEQTDLEGAAQPDQGAQNEGVPPPEPPLADAQAGRRQNVAGRRWLVVALVILLVLAGGAGAFALIRQQTSADASSQCAGSPQAGCANTATGGSRVHATQLTFSGSISGPLTLSAQVRCQTTTTGNLRTLMVTLSGTVGGQLYNFGFVINNYTGPGTYNAPSPTLTILLDVPGEATNNGWGNTSSTDSGTITVERGERTGSITYVLSGFGSRAGTQIQVSGEWACG